MEYGLNKQQAEAVAKHGFEEFAIFIEDVNKKIRQKKLAIENVAGYIIGAYQKKGIIPKKS